MRILKLCKEAISTKEGGGNVIILEKVIDVDKGDHQSVETQLFFDVLMMVEIRNRNMFANFHPSKVWGGLVSGLTNLFTVYGLFTYLSIKYYLRKQYKVLL